MSGKLVVRQALGINGNVKNCLTFVEDHSLAYVCGHQVVILNTELREQVFIPATNTYQHQSLGFTAIAACFSKKLIAVAEKVDPNAIVTFYDAKTLRRKKVLASSDIASKEIKCLAFSDDGRFLLTQGAGPDWNLILWHVEKAAKAICSVRIAQSEDNSVHAISFCPWDNTVILVLGRSVLRLFRFVEGQLRPMALTVRRDQASFISHCWLGEETLIIGTEAGELLMIENFEFRGYISTVKADQVQEEDPYPALCLQTSGRGFILGSLNGEIKLFDRHEEVKEKYLLEDVLHLSEEVGDLLEFALGAEDVLVCATSRQQLLASSLSNLNNVKEGLRLSFEPLFANFPCPNSRGEAAITGLDVSLWKPLLVTCSRDCILRIWNPIERKVELSRQFDEEPQGLSLHPSGLYCAVLFPDKIRLLTLLLEEIYTSREIAVRQVNLIKFSRGGHYLAAAAGTNLIVYQTHTGTAVATLRGHNNRIRSILWLNCDSQIITVGAEGTVYYWDLFPVAKRAEHYPGTVPIAVGAGPTDGSSVFIATHDKLIRELAFGRTDVPTNAGGLVPAGAGAVGGGAGGAMPDSIVVKTSKTIDLQSFVDHMIFDETRKLLLMGTSSSSSALVPMDESSGGKSPAAGVRANANSTTSTPCAIVVTLTVPSLGGGGTAPILEMNTLHSAPITALALSSDGNTVYSGDANGCIIISEFEAFTNTTAGTAVTAAGAKSPGKQREGLVAFDFVEEVVIHKTDLEARKAQIAQLTQTVEELNASNDHQMRLKELEHKDRLKEITEKFLGQLKAEKMKYEELENEKKSIERDFDRKVKALEEKHSHELQSIEFKYKSKQNAEENRHKDLQQEIEMAQRRWQEENEVLLESHRQYLADLSADYSRRLSMEQHLQESLSTEKEKQSVSYEEVKKDTELDGDREMAEMKIRYDAKLQQEEEMAQQLMGQHTIMTKNHESLAKEFSSQKMEIKRLRDKEQRLYETIHTLEKDIQSHKKEIREREETITDKEKRIFDLKKKNQELEKFRFVLDYKIKELKLQIAPRENEINTMRKQIEEMNLELEQYEKSNQALNLMIEELKLKMEGIRTELDSQDERCAISERFMDKFRRDIQELWTVRNDLQVFKSKVIRMYRIYVQEDVSPAMMGENAAKKRDLEDPQQLYNRDREQMERSLDSLRRAMKTEAVVHRRDLSKMMRENVLLTKELNALRKTGRYIHLQKKAIDQLGDLHNSGGSMGDGGGGSMPEGLKIGIAGGGGSTAEELMELLGIEVKTPAGLRGKRSTQPHPPSSSASVKEGTAAAGGHNAKTATAAAAVGGHSRRFLPPPRSAALRTTSADGIPLSQTVDPTAGSSSLRAQQQRSRQDQWQAWREAQMQFEAMQHLEDRIGSLCQTRGMDPVPLIVGVDAKLYDVRTTGPLTLTGGVGGL